MQYVVIASYRQPSAPMSLEKAQQMVRELRAAGIHCHAQPA